MKKKLLALTLCLVLMIAPIATIGVFAGTENGYTFDADTNTYTVTTADGLLAVAAEINSEATNAARNITLAADIDLAGKTWTPIGQKGKTAYSGTFNGAGYTISNLKNIVDLQAIGMAGYCGLIGKASDGCTVKNLNFTGADVMGVEISALVIGETVQADTTKTDKVVLVENVHVRNSNVKGSNGWDEATYTPESTNKSYAKNEYTGVIIGKAGAYYTEVKNCTVVANVTSECRASGIIGGEAVGSSVTTCNITIENCIVGGVINQAPVATIGSNAVRAGGASAFMGYHSTIPATIKNCVSVATISVTNGTAGALAFDINKLSISASNCVVIGAPLGKINDVTKGTFALSNISVYALGSENATTPVATNFVGRYKVNNVNTDVDNSNAPVKYDDADTTWVAIAIPVISDKDAFETKVATMFAINEYITEDMVKDITHEHTFDCEVVSETFLKSEATCTAVAVYYKSCKCGTFDTNATFTSGDPIAHTPNDKWSCDETNHWHVCSSCLEAKSDEGAHTYGEWTVTDEPTAIREGKKVKACTACGYEIEEKIPTVTPEVTDTEAPAETTGGCGGAVLGVGALIVTTLGMGVAFLRKKED